MIIDIKKEKDIWQIVGCNFSHCLTADDIFSAKSQFMRYISEAFDEHVNSHFTDLYMKRDENL